MIYPTNLPHPQAPAEMSGGESFRKTQFYHGVRVSPTHCNTYKLQLSFTCKSRTQMMAFKDFYYSSLVNGSKPFDAFWEVEGSLQRKTFRFLSRYKARLTSGQLYSVSAEFELLTPIKELT